MSKIWWILCCCCLPRCWSIHQPRQAYNRDNPNNCGIGPVNAQTWKQYNVDAFLSKVGASGRFGNDLSSGLAQEYAPNLAKSISVCNVNEKCSPVSCELIDLDREDAREAFFVLEAIANFNNFLKQFIDGIVAAQTLANSFTLDWVKQFSYVEKFEREDRFRRSLLGVLQAAFSFVLSFAGLPGAIAGSASGVIFTSIAQKNRDFPDKYDVAANLGAYIGNLSNSSTDAIRNLGQRLLSGKPDAGGNHIWHYLANGTFADANALKSADIAGFLKKQYVAAGINGIWSSQRTYIAAAPTEPGKKCEDDRRGPRESGLCMEDHEDMVYYAYYMPKGGGYQQLFVPHGYTKLNQYAPLDMKSIMISSIRAYRAAKFDYASIRQKRWIEAFKNSTTSNAASPFDLGYSFEGMFTLPVCFHPLGGGISKVKSDKGRRYPCQCFDQTKIANESDVARTKLNFSDPTADVAKYQRQLRAQETIEFLYAAEMNQDKSWFGFCNDKTAGACGDIQGKVGGKLNVEKQNNTFGYCSISLPDLISDLIKNPAPKKAAKVLFWLQYTLMATLFLNL